MPVLAEAISVIIKDASIHSRFIGGMKYFLETLPNATHCTDDQVHRVGFMVPDDAQAYIRFLTQNGLVYLLDGRFVDFGVADMMYGPWAPSDWLGFARQPFFAQMTEYDHAGEEFSICWLLDLNHPKGITLNSNGEFPIMTPEDWTPDTALYTSNFIPAEKIDDRLTEAEQNDGITSFWDSELQKLINVGNSQIADNDNTDKN